MIEIDLGPIESSPVTLSLTKDPLRELREAPPKQLAGRFSLGVPIVLRLDAELLEADPEAVVFLAQNPTSAFHLVRLACTFDNRKEEPFLQAWLQVELGNGAIAWSMRPMRDSDFRDVSSKVKLEVGLKLAEIGAKASREQGDATKEETPFISAKGLQESSPRWQFRRTPTRALDGSFPLQLIVRSPLGAGSSGRVAFKATVQHTKLGIVTYEIDAADAPPGVSLALR